MLPRMNGFEVIHLYMSKGDLRREVDGLIALVEGQFNLNLFQKNVLFLFYGTRSGRFKGLVWGDDGFCLVYKCIEADRLRQLCTQREAVQISQAEFQRLPDSMTILECSAVKKVNCTQIS